MTAREVKAVVGGEKNTFEIRRLLQSAGIPYEDVTKEAGYFNLRVQNEKGYVTIFRSFRNEIKVIQVYKTIIQYSGIPAYEQRGRRMF